ncbi:ADP-ribosylglycohydrolase family protein [Streptomyces laurentii]
MNADPTPAAGATDRRVGAAVAPVLGVVCPDGVVPGTAGRRLAGTDPTRPGPAAASAAGKPGAAGGPAPFARTAGHGSSAGGSRTAAGMAPPPEPALEPGGPTRGSVMNPDPGPRTAEPSAADAEAGAAGAPSLRDIRLDGGAAGTPVRRDRIEGLLLGIAAGDAAGWPAVRHRAARMPEWTRRLTRELDTFAEENATTTLPVPLALNQPPEPLRLGPSDDAEWAVFTAGALLARNEPAFRGLTPGLRLRAAVDLAWHSLAGQVAAAADRAPEVESAVLPLRARISVRAGLGNLAAGLRPPATGHDNPHYFDDAACVRAAVLALAHPGEPGPAAALAEFDARYTQDGDGVHGARAMAAAVAAALGGAAPEEAVEAALAELPPGTEIGRNGRYAVGLARTAGTAFALVPLLEHQIVDHVYSYGIAAAETVPVALALTVAARGEAAAALPAAACLSRVADSAPALAGALTGALGGGSSVPATWRAACRTLAGCALPWLAGTDLVEFAGRLAAAATEPATPGGQSGHDSPSG